MQVLKGKPCVVQAENSDVKLHVRKGVKGILLGNIHTDIARFSHLIPRNDCVLGPVCEYHIHPLNFNGKVMFSKAKFRLEIPHALENVYATEKKLKIRCMESGKTRYISHSSEPFHVKTHHFLSENDFLFDRLC